MCKSNCKSCKACQKANAGKIFLTDSVSFNNDEKTLVSVRDGVLNYFGYEIGMGEDEVSYTVYRSKDTIEKLSKKLIGLPITDEHIEMDDEAYNVIGNITTSEIVENIDENNLSTIAVLNKAWLKDESVLEQKRDVSLGFFADLKLAEEDEPYDFIQTEIIPHHLGLVDVGRCGNVCNFKDEVIMKNKFKDEDGKLSLKEVSEALANLPEIIKDFPLADVEELIVKMKETAKRILEERDDVVMEEMDEDKKDENKDEDEEIEEKTEVVTETKDDERPEDEMLDEDEKEILKTKSMDSRKYIDSVKGYVDAKVKEHTKIVLKSKEFLDKNYDFANKTSKQIMRDTVRTLYSESFTDSELSTVFKMLKKNEHYKKFGDQQSISKNDFMSLADKEI